MPDSDAIKSVLRMFNYGLFVATTSSPDGPRAATISWVTQVSFEPKLVAVAMRKGSAICEAVRASRRFALHVVGENQPDFARAFFRTIQAGPSDLAGFRYEPSAAGVPILGAAVAWIECEVTEEAGSTGDHTVFIAAVVNGEVQMPGIASLSLRSTMWHYGG